MIDALGEHFGEFAILQIDAHADLRVAYEGFEYSHASIMYNALKRHSVQKLVQVGIRDYCQAELEIINNCFEDNSCLDIDKVFIELNTAIDNYILNEYDNKHYYQTKENTKL